MTTTTNRHSRQRVLQSTETDYEKHRPSSISVVIPTYNERENIARVIQRCRNALEQRDFEIIVVDDDSPDKTWQVARQLFADDEDVRVVRRRDGADLSTAVSRGFRESTKDACAVIDADLQHPPEKVPALFEALQDGADIAVGSRYVKGGGIDNWSLFRRLVSKGATLVSHGAIPATRRLSDPMSGFFAVQKRFLENVELEPKGYKILLEVLVKCDWEEVTEVPYVFAERDRGDSNLTSSQYVQFIEHVLSLTIVSRDWDRVVDPDRVVKAVEFGFVGGIGAAINTVVFIIMFYLFRTGHIASGILAFFFAVNWNFAGNWLLTFNRPDGSLLTRYLTFFGVSIGGFIIYLSILTIGIDFVALPAFVANTIAIGAGAVFNFLGAENVVFITSTSSLPRFLFSRENSVRLRVEDSDAETQREVHLQAKELDKIIRALEWYRKRLYSSQSEDHCSRIIDKLEGEK